MAPPTFKMPIGSHKLSMFDYMQRSKDRGKCHCIIVVKPLSSGQEVERSRVQTRLAPGYVLNIKKNKRKNKEDQNIIISKTLNLNLTF